MQQPTGRGGRGRSANRPKVVLFQGHDDATTDAQRELDLDLYDTDELPDSPPPPPQQQSGLSLSDLPSIHTLAAAPPTATQPRGSDVGSVPSSSQNRTHHERETASSGGGSSRTRQLLRRPVNPHPTIRTNFTTTGYGAMPCLEASFAQLETPPGEPPHALPEETVHPAYSRPPRTELSMRAEWVIGLVLVGLGLGIAIGSQAPDAQLAYWLTTLGQLYVRMTACLTFPMAFCQVATCTAELLNGGKLRRAWRYTAFYFVLQAVLSIWFTIGLAGAFHSRYERHSPKDYRIAHAPFALRCHNGGFLEQQLSGQITCSGAAIAANTTFPRLVDVSQRLGLEDAVGSVSISGYVFTMVEVFFPQNAAHSLSHDNYLSALLIAAVLGVAVGKSYPCRPGEIRRSRNPLFRFFTHVYLSLFAMSEWVQKAAMWATVPILTGAVLAMPNIADTLSLTRYYIASVLLAGAGQCLVVVPLIFYVVVHENPYRWARKMLAPISYGMVLQNAFLSLPMATKAVLRTHEISPSVFGGVYPVLSALNRSHFALGCPSAILYVAAFSGCHVELTASSAFRMFGLTFLGCFGDTMLPNPGMAYFLMMWRAFCENEDTPSSALMITTIGILVYRISACVGSATNLLLIRVIAHSVELEDEKWQRQLDDAFHRRGSAASAASAPVASPLSM